MSKVAADRLGFQYHQSYGIKILVTRSFNYIGPKRGEVFMTSNFAKQIVEIEEGFRDPMIRVENLESQRDFSDVRGIVKAYWLCLQKCKFGEVYNICSERAIKMQKVLNIILDMTKIKNIEVKKDTKRLRPSGVEVLLGDCTKFKKQTGWKITIPFEKTMRDLLEYRRNRI